MVNTPSASVITPLLLFFTLTETPGNPLPLSSVIFPLIVLEIWEKLLVAATISSSKNNSGLMMQIHFKELFTINCRMETIVNFMTVWF